MNQYLFTAINHFAGSNVLLDKTMIFLADWLPYLMVLVFGLVAFKHLKKNMNFVYVSFGSAALAYVVTWIIRFFYHHPRPFLVLNNVHLIMSHDSDPSFPSAHTAVFFALSTGIYFFNKKLGTIFLVLSLLMGFARVFVGVHWPYDILGGIILGVISAFIMKYIHSRHPARLN